MAGNGDDILVTEGLGNSFRDFRAVSDVSLAGEARTIHALIGPNGAGKTTCFNLLTKFLPPTRGRILYNGRDITDCSPPTSRGSAWCDRSRFPPCFRI